MTRRRKKNTQLFLNTKAVEETYNIFTNSETVEEGLNKVVSWATRATTRLAIDTVENLAKQSIHAIAKRVHAAINAY